MRRSKYTIALTTLVLPALLLATLPTASASDDIGKTAYTASCTKCHGDDGKGDTKVGRIMKTPDITIRPWKDGDTLDDLIKLIKEGRGKMKKEKKLNDAEIKAAAEYTLKLVSTH